MKNTIKFGLGGAALALSFGASAAQASVRFTISDGTDPATTFTLPTSPTPVASGPGVFFVLLGVPVTSGGVTAPEELGFANPANYGVAYGGIDLVVEGLVNIVETGGPILYKGPESAPTFLPGSYTAVNAFTGLTDTITISDAPEPFTWALMLVGLGGLGATLRGARRKSGAAAAAAPA